MRCFALFAALAACGETSGSGTGGSAGSAGSGRNDGGETQDGNHGDTSQGAPDAEAAALTKLCSEVGAYAKRCSSSLDACDKSIAADCPGVYGVYRSEYLDALGSCGLPATQCSPAGIDDAPFASCDAKALGAIAPTPAQEKLATDVCHACGSLPGGAACPGKGFFTLGKACGSGCVTVSGAGISFLFLNGSLVDTVESSCLAESVLGPPGGTDCWANFYACIGKQQQAAEPPAFDTACQVQPGM
jgi:hypothetical protein